MMSRAIRVLLACMLLAATLMGAALTVPGLTEPAWAQETSTTATPPQPLAGAASYAANCAPCHGQTGQGDGPSASGLSVPPAKLADVQLAASKSLAEWFDITKNGNMQRMMPPWKERLTDQEIWDTVAYAWTLHTSAGEVELGQQVYEANCASCHGPDGQGTDSVAGVPDLTDFAATSSVAQATWAQAVAAGKGEMPGFADKLSAEEQAAVLVHTRRLSFGGPMFRGPLAKGTGVITGTVTNETTGEPLTGLTVELGVFDTTALLGQQTAVSDANGVYSFAELDTDPGLAYVVRTDYPTGVPYNTDFVSFGEGETSKELSLAVYETTTEAASLRTDRVHYIVEFESGQALIAELLLFSLDGNRTYTGDGTAVLQVSLPAGAQNVEIDGDDGSGRFELTGDGFVDKLPLRPGANVRQLLFRYSLPYTSGQFDLVHTLAYPAANVNALISDVGQQVSSPQLANQGVRSTENGGYHNLLGQNLAAGQQILIRMTNLPTAGGVSAAAGTTGSGGLNPWLLAALIGLAAGSAVALILLPIVRGRASGAGAAAIVASGATRADLVDALARLDLSYEAGELSETAYQEQRLRLKAQLSDLLRREGGA